MAKTEFLKQRMKIKTIAKRYNLSLILAFGSQVKGKTHQNSDLDIAVLPQKELDYKKYSELYSDLSEVFKGQGVDLVLIGQVDPLLLKKIVENCQILYGSQRLLAQFKIYTFKRYGDYRKYFDLERGFVHQFIKEFK